MTHHTESEFKLRAREPIEVATVDAVLRELRQNCRLAASRSHTDTYLDDERGSLIRQGIGLRLRAGGGRRLLTCKAQRKDDGRLFIRDEVEVPWQAEQLPTSAEELPAELRPLIEPIVAERMLAPQQTLTVAREVRMLTSGQEDLCELAIDFVTATADERSVTFQEIELEVFSDLNKNQQLAAELHARLPVEFAQTDKPRHAAALLGIETAEPARGQFELQPLDSLIPEQLREILAANNELEHAVRDVGHQATVHQMQLGIERMDALVVAFRDLWDPDACDRMTRHLRTTHRHLSAVEDLYFLVDNLRIHAPSLPPGLHEAKNEAVLWAERQRDVGMDRLSEWLGDPRRQATSEEFAQDIAKTLSGSETASGTLQHQAGPLLASAIGAVRELLAACEADRLPDDLGPLGESLRHALHVAEHLSRMTSMSYKKSTKAIARVLRHLDRAASLERTVHTLLLTESTATDEVAASALGPAALGGLATLHHQAALEARATAEAALERLDREAVWRRFLSG